MAKTTKTKQMRRLVQDPWAPSEYDEDPRQMDRPVNGVHTWPWLQEVKGPSGPPGRSGLPLPAYGPGSLAGQGFRLLARVIDGIILIPWVAVSVLLGREVIIWQDKISFTTQGYSTGSIEFGLFVMAVCYLAGFLVYDGYLTHRNGRTPGKATAGIRPQWIGGYGRDPSTGEALGRSAIYLILSCIPVVGLLDVLACLWDAKRQCWHDKLPQTVVISDR